MGKEQKLPKDAMMKVQDKYRDKYNLVKTKKRYTSVTKMILFSPVHPLKFKVRWLLYKLFKKGGKICGECPLKEIVTEIKKESGE